MTAITPQNILRHELIGLDVRITSAKDANMRGIKGMIVNESRNMLTLADGPRKWLIPKDIATFRFKLKDGTLVDVDGTRLVGRPENRLKTKMKRW